VSTEGRSTIHTLTDPVIRAWFNLKDRNIDAEFNTPGLTLPSATEIAAVEGMVQAGIQDYLGAVAAESPNATPATFNILTTPFDARQSVVFL
jgi:hypothetical protein